MLAAALLSAACASAQGDNSTSRKDLTASQRTALLSRKNDQIQRFTRTAWHWDEVLGRPHKHFGYQPGDSNSIAYVQWVLGQRKAAAHRLHVQAKHLMVKRTKFYQSETAKMRTMMGRTGTTSSRQLSSAGSIEARFNHTRSAYKQTLHDWRNPPDMAQLMCIHHGEGSWNSISNPKYKGGLQMDVYFEATYGAVFVVKYGGHIETDSGGHKYAVGGHANLWTPVEQMWAAENAIHSGRGFYPWPYTAHQCGLI